MYSEVALLNIDLSQFRPRSNGPESILLCDVFDSSGSNSALGASVLRTCATESCRALQKHFYSGRKILVPIPV